MKHRVWLQDWQFQCCGDPFSIGDHVRWTAATDVDAVTGEYLETALGEKTVASLTDYEDSHEVSSRPTREIGGTVTGIRAAWCAYEFRDRTGYPVPGTTLLKRRERATRSEPVASSAHFLGYIVDLD